MHQHAAKFEIGSPAEFKSLCDAAVRAEIFDFDYTRAGLGTIPSVWFRGGISKRVLETYFDVHKDFRGFYIKLGVYQNFDETLLASASRLLKENKGFIRLTTHSGESPNRGYMNLELSRDAKAQFSLCLTLVREGTKSASLQPFHTQLKSIINAINDGDVESLSELDPNNEACPFEIKLTEGKSNEVYNFAEDRETMFLLIRVENIDSAVARFKKAVSQISLKQDEASVWIDVKEEGLEPVAQQFAGQFDLCNAKIVGAFKPGVDVIKRPESFDERHTIALPLFAQTHSDTDMMAIRIVHQPKSSFVELTSRNRDQIERFLKANSLSAQFWNGEFASRWAS